MNSKNITLIVLNRLLAERSFLSLKFGFTTCLTIFALQSQFLKADVTPQFVTYKEIDFGNVLHITGNCTMDHTDGSFSDATPSSMCGGYGNGQRGHYLIIAPPNKTIQIEFSQRDNEGDGFVFIPAGEMSSSAETVAIVPNTTQTISSGGNGGVTIYMGGQLLITSPTTPATNFELTKNNGIEWSVLP